MKTVAVSSLSIRQALRYSMSRMQSELVTAQKESTTLRVADVGLALGARTGHSVSLARDVSRLNSLLDSNQLAASRLSSTQSALGQLTERGEELRTALAAALSGSSDPGVARADGDAMLDTLTSIMNTSINGEYLFAGVNTDVQPISNFKDPNSTARVAFDTAFQTHFGFSQTDPAAANITEAQMTAFIDNVVEPQFMGAGWNTNWSNASDDPITARIGLNETAKTSVSANQTGVRKLAMAAAISASLLSGPVNSGAVSAVVNRALAYTAEGISEITDERSATGIQENRISNASSRIEMQIDIFERSILDMEGVDPYAAASKVSALVTQIETAYSLTSRIQQLSLLKFLG
jgi:flagellar hook-associated protein 3 FlgL